LATTVRYFHRCTQGGGVRGERARETEGREESKERREKREKRVKREESKERYQVWSGHMSV